MMNERVRRTRKRRITSRQSSGYVLCSNAAREERGVFGFSKLNCDSLFSRSRFSGRIPMSICSFKKEPELIGQIEVGLIIRSRGKQNDLRIVPLDVFADCLVDFSFAVTEIVRLVDDDETVAGELL